MQNIWNSEGMVVREGLGENCKRRQNWGGFDQNALYTHMKFTNNIQESSRLISVPVAAQNQWLRF